MSRHVRIGHDLIRTGDPETHTGDESRWRSPICDGNGEVVLSQCRKCNRGEAQLEQPCVSLIWATPDGDKQIAHLARVSNPKATPDDPSERLISYLLRNHHWSPFQMASMCVEINTTRDITAQILRHASFGFQEFSTRYADVEELEDWKECRFQDDKNRQNSYTADETPSPDTPERVKWWNGMVDATTGMAETVYREARERGIAKEVARSILPIGLIPSKLYMTGTVRSWLHYIAERTKPGVQKEHREVAEACRAILASAFPQVYAAFQFEQDRAEREREALAKVRHMLAPGSDTADCLFDVIRDSLVSCDQVVSEFGLRAAVTEVVEWLRRELGE